MLLHMAGDRRISTNVIHFRHQSRWLLIVLCPHLFLVLFRRRSFTIDTLLYKSLRNRGASPLLLLLCVMRSFICGHRKRPGFARPK